MAILLIPVLMLLVPIVIITLVISSIVDYFFGTNWFDHVGDFWF